MKLVVLRIGGNWFDVQDFVNQHDIAEGVVSISEMIGNYTLVAVRLNFDQVAKLRRVGVIKQGENL
jgi:hypothetical protein